MLLLGCRKEDMADQPRHDPLEQSRMFQDELASRPLVAGTVPRGGQIVREETSGHTPPSGNESADFPWKLSMQDLQRGRERFDIYCSVCHGRLGTGDGMIVQRGFLHPPSFYLDRLRAAAPGHFYNVISDGYGAMYAYNDRVPVEDRWRIIGYIRALQIARPDDRGIGTTPPAQQR